MRSNKIRVLLTVPHLSSDASPYREMIAMARYLPKDEFSLTICSLRRTGIEETGPLLESLGIRYFVAKFRIKSLREIKRFFAENRLIQQMGPFDIQHSFDFSTVPLEAIVARFYGRKFIHQQRNMNENGHLIALKIKISFSTKVVAISQAVFDFLKQSGTPLRKIEKISYGIDAENEIPENISHLWQESKEHKTETNQPTLLMVAQTIPRKKIEDAIRAVLTLRKTFPGIKLLIVGPEYDHDYKTQLANLIQQFRLEENINFVGVLPNEQVLELMRRADLFVHCAEHEAFGWVLLEAFSQKLPVIAAASEGPSEIIEDGFNGFLYPVGAPELLTEKINSILNDKALRMKIANRAFNDIRGKFSAQEMVKQIANLYREIT